MENEIEELNDELNIVPILHTNKIYTIHITSKDGRLLVNKPIICKCEPHPKNHNYSPDEYREYLIHTDEEGRINLVLDDYYAIDKKENKEKQKEKQKTQKNKLREEQKRLWDEKQKEFAKNEPQSIAIELKNIGINFKITNDKIDNLKEYVIRTLKRNKGDVQVFHALKDISMKVHKGEKIGLIGYNGAGKSTLLKIISGVYDADEGTMKINGNIAPLLSLGAGFDKNYSGRENIFLNGAILGYNEKFLKEKYDEILEFSGLEDFINLPVKNYSAGMKAKLGFSVATLVDPEILIIDEVLGVGDITFKKKSREKLEELMDSGTTVILVSHSIEEIRKICDTAIWIDQGQVRDYGEVNEICDKYVEDAKKATKEQLKKQRLR
ncbi:MAG: ABC transporter ATP-binding protein [archaeon]|nr:ABC transporter ATP-binding protein [archaeon]